MRIISIFSSTLRLLSLRMSLIDGSVLRVLELVDDFVVPVPLEAGGLAFGPGAGAGFGLAANVPAERRASSIPIWRSLLEMPFVSAPCDRARLSKRLGWSSTYWSARFRTGAVSGS